MRVPRRTRDTLASRAVLRDHLEPAAGTSITSPRVASEQVFTLERGADILAFLLDQLGIDVASEG